MRTSVLHLGGVLLAVGLLVGCATTSIPGNDGAKFMAENDEPGCADWVPFDSVDEASDSGVLTVRAELKPRSETVTMQGEQAALYRATVTEVFVGDATIGDVLDVVSTPASCTAEAPYPDGDPMLRDEATLVLTPGAPARGSADFFQTITPYAGVWDERPIID